MNDSVGRIISQLFCPRIDWKSDPAVLQGYENKRGKSTGSKRNYALAARTIAILDKDRARFEYLLLPEPRLMILAALGRVADEEFLMRMADEICQHKCRHKIATEFIRRCLGKTRGRSKTTFELVLLRAIQKYQKEFEITDAQIASRLRALSWQFDGAAHSAT